ncbi:MAG: secondary thiamine-phosphate synthase enzyme YjbQ [Candidatus Heimdallarchaeaceae archaeon]
MQVFTKIIHFQTEGEIDIVDLTQDFEAILAESAIENGILSANVIGSTGALTAIEYERGVLDDFKQILQKLVPKGAGYKHDFIDSNAHSHLRASLIGPSISFSIQKKQLQLGTWQQPVFVCLDIRPRSRKVAVTVVGE